MPAKPLHRHTCVDRLARLAVILLVSLTILLYDIGMQILYASSFMLLIAVDVYVFCSLRPYNNPLATLIVGIMNCIPIFTGLTNFLALLLAGRVALDAYFMLFAIAPFTGIFAYIIISKREEIAMNYLTSFHNLERTLSSLKTIQRLCLFKRTLQLFYRINIIRNIHRNRE